VPLRRARSIGREGAAVVSPDDRADIPVRHWRDRGMVRRGRSAVPGRDKNVPPIELRTPNTENWHSPDKSGCPTLRLMRMTRPFASSDDRADIPVRHWRDRGMVRRGRSAVPGRDKNVPPIELLPSCRGVVGLARCALAAWWGTVRHAPVRRTCGLRGSKRSPERVEMGRPAATPQITGCKKTASPERAG